MEAAKKGILTKEMKSIAESEAMDEKILMQRVASGEIAIPANKNHSSLVAKGVGKSKSCHRYEGRCNNGLEFIW